MPLTAQGLVLPRITEILDEIDARYLADTGLELDSANPDNSDQLLVRLNGYVADQLVTLAEAIQGIYDQFDPDGAQGVQASLVARLVGVERKKPTSSQVTLTLTGTSGTVILEGSLVQGGTSDPLARWSTEESVTLSGGTATVLATATEAGAVTALAGTITTIVNPRDGWASVTNAAAAAVGLAEETDQALLRRRKDALARRAGCGVPGIRSRLLALSFVQSAVVLANGENTERTIQGVTMPPNSYLVVVLPNVLTDVQKQDILGVLYDSSLATSEPAGTDVSGTVLHLADGTSWPVAFDFGAELTVTVAFTITATAGASVADARARIGAAVRALLPLGLSETLTRLRLCALAYDTGIVQTATVTIDAVDADKVPNFDQRISTITVTVNGVAV